MSIPFWFTLLLIILVQMAAEIGAAGHGKEKADTSSKPHPPSTSSADGHAEHITQQQQQGGQGNESMLFIFIFR